MVIKISELLALRRELAAFSVYLLDISNWILHLLGSLILWIAEQYWAFCLYKGG